MLYPGNAGLVLPLILTGPKASASYFEQIDHFLCLTLGEAATSRYQIIVDDPEAVAVAAVKGVHKVREQRLQSQDALLRAFVEQRRMKMVGECQPCYRVVG